MTAAGTDLDIARIRRDALNEAARALEQQAKQDCAVGRNLDSSGSARRKNAKAFRRAAKMVRDLASNPQEPPAGWLNPPQDLTPLIEEINRAVRDLASRTATEPTVVGMLDRVTGRPATVYTPPEDLIPATEGTSDL